MALVVWVPQTTSTDGLSNRWCGVRYPGGQGERHPSRLSLPEQQVENHGQDDRKDDAGGDRNVNGHASTLKREIPRQMEPTEEHQPPADHGQQNAKDEKQPPYVLHLSREQFLSRSEIAVAGCGFQTEATMAPGGRSLPGHLTNRPFHNVGAHDLRSWKYSGAILAS